jgi:hypothetical protein
MRHLRTLLTGLTISMLLSAQSAPQVNVYKTATCGCCKKWVEHLKANGFAVTATDVRSVAEYREKYGVPDAMQSCHTAVVNGYTIEGHVPAADILRLLKSGSKAKGLAVPGMPMGSPGMEQGSRVDPYAVMLFDSRGKTSVYQKYPRD